MRSKQKLIRHRVAARQSLDTLHLIDVENLCHGTVRAPRCANLWGHYRRQVPVGPRDHIVVAASTPNAAAAFFVFPTNTRRIAVPARPDAADLALLAAVEPDTMIRRYRRVVIASGDHLFADLAECLHAVGKAPIQVVSDGTGVSAGLYRHCAELVRLPWESARGSDAPALAGSPTPR
ncbi:hypothetical protein [Nocardia lasii]|uniref:NYN domain-containing protein n=1 Tax=Nocardia lasii TaxID=1616107 RepID=A0ABW1JS12_9NOCA